VTLTPEDHPFAGPTGPVDVRSIRAGERAELADLRTHPAAKHVQRLAPYSAFGVPLDMHYAIDRLSFAADGVPKNTNEHAG
jgi:hypothetical protein